jgi:hypothetical protein
VQYKFPQSIENIMFNHSLFLLYLLHLLYLPERWVVFVGIFWFEVSFSPGKIQCSKCCTSTRLESMTYRNLVPQFSTSAVSAVPWRSFQTERVNNPVGNGLDGLIVGFRGAFHLHQRAIFAKGGKFIVECPFLLRVFDKASLVVTIAP